MYFYKDTKLASDLHKGIVTEKQQMLYFFITSLFITVISSRVFSFYYWYGQKELTIFDFFNDIMNVLFMIAFIFIPYKINNLGDSKEFLSRFVCLFLPIQMKSTIISIPLVIPAIAYSFYVGPSLEELEVMNPNTKIELTLTEHILFLLGVLFTYLFALWRYIVCFKIASGQKEIKE